MDRVGRQWLSLAVFVVAAVVFEVAVVAGDPGGGELVEPDRAELGADVVADDLLVPLDRGRRELEARRPLIRVGTNGRHLVAELLVLLPLLQRLLQGVVGLVGAGEPGTGEPARSHLGVFGVFQDVDLEPPPLPLIGVVGLDRAGLPGAGAPLLLLTPAALLMAGRPLLWLRAMASPFCWWSVAPGRSVSAGEFVDVVGGVEYAPVRVELYASFLDHARACPLLL